MTTLIVTDDIERWSFLKSQALILDSSDYLFNRDGYNSRSTRVINLSGSYHYQSLGYYVSLLAEARLEVASPSIHHIQDTYTKNIYEHISQSLDNDIQEAFKHITNNTITLDVYFGKNATIGNNNLVEKLYALFPMHLLRFEFEKTNKWAIKTLHPLAIQELCENDMQFMHTCAYRYFDSLPNQSVMTVNTSRCRSNKKSYGYNLALLTEPAEGEVAPSNAKAIEQFILAGQKIGLNVDVIAKDDMRNTTKYDALFIRATTAVNHYTYQMARNAALDNLVVMDDPQSIIRCTNKVYLAELFDVHQILTPPTQLISKYNPDYSAITYPCVLKKPDSSCSMGVIKIDNLQELEKATEAFFETSDILIVQAFMPTEFDWRIGIIDNKPLYACRYYMAKDHWQIVDWNTEDRLIHDAVAIEDVPDAVIQLALKTTKLIGDSLYGVDIKSIGDKAYMIEVNDNPSVNAEVDDVLLKNTLYERIMEVFLHRIQKKQGTLTPERTVYTAKNFA